jgi:hypothetical protein
MAQPMSNDELARRQQRYWPPARVSPNPIVNRLLELPGDKRVKLIRTLVYEGPVNWVGRTLDMSWVKAAGEEFEVKLPIGASVRCIEETLEEID